MAEKSTKASVPQGASVDEFYNKGLQRLCGNIRSDEGIDAFCGVGELEYREMLTLDEARLLRHIVCTNMSVKKVVIWHASLNAVKAAFEDLEDASALEELEFLLIECEEHKYSLNLSGIFKRLRSLRLECDDICNDSAKIIAYFLRDNSSLENFHLRSEQLTDHGATTIAESLRTNSALKQFTIHHEKLTSKSIVAFAETLVVNSTLELVDLHKIDMKDEDMLPLFEEERYAGTFKRMNILWDQKYLPQLARLLREDRHYSQLFINVSSSASGDLVREFFEALANNRNVRMLQLYPSGETSEALTEGLVNLVKRTSTMTAIYNLMSVGQSGEPLVRVLDALKTNRSVTEFMWNAEFLTPEIAATVSDLLASNETLNDLSVSQNDGITSDIVATILGGLRKNYTLTRIMLAWDPYDDVEGIGEMEGLLRRNAELLNRAAHFVRDSHGTTDPEGADALRKISSSGGLVQKLEELTGQTRETVLGDTEAALARLDLAAHDA